MRSVLPLTILASLLAGCGATTVARDPSVVPAAQPRPSVLPSKRAPARARRLVLSGQYRAFVGRICRGLASGNAVLVRSALPYYEYNSGVRFGAYGDGEGQTGDPGLIASWLASRRVRCRELTPDLAGHGTVLASGFRQPGGWSLLDLDTYGGTWKINDFTFGSFDVLRRAMQTSGHVFTYHG